MRLGRRNLAAVREANYVRACRRTRTRGMGANNGSVKFGVWSKRRRTIDIVVYFFFFLPLIIIAIERPTTA